MAVPHKFSRRFSFGCIGLAGLATSLAISFFPSPLPAVQLGDGSTMFTNPPRLVSFVTDENEAARRNVTYSITVNLLPDAGEPLQTLRVSLIEGRFRRLNYRLDHIEVSGSGADSAKEKYAISSASFDDDSQVLTINLVDPIPPGQMATFELDLVRNPSRAGVYLYDVSAAPTGENPVFQRVGTGRINIFENEFLNIRR